MKSFRLWIVRISVMIVISILIIAALVHFRLLDMRLVAASLTEEGIYWLLPAFIVQLSTVVLGAIRYGLILRVLGQEPPKRQILASTGLSQAIGQWLPGSTGVVEALRVAMMLGSEGGSAPLTLALASLIDRILAQAVMFLLAGIAIFAFVLTGAAEPSVETEIVISGVVALFVGVILLFVPMLSSHEWTKGFLSICRRFLEPKRGKYWLLLARGFAIGESIRAQLAQCNFRSKYLRSAALVSAAIVGVGVFVTYACAEAIRVRLPALSIVATQPLISLTSILPLGFAGLGGSQVVSIGIYGIFSVQKAAAANASLLYALVALTTNTIWGVGLAISHAGVLRQVFRSVMARDT